VPLTSIVRSAVENDGVPFIEVDRYRIALVIFIAEPQERCSFTSLTHRDSDRVLTGFTIAMKLEFRAPKIFSREGI
jgi:hypothetical protein